MSDAQKGTRELAARVVAAVNATEPVRPICHDDDCPYHVRHHPDEKCTAGVKRG